MSLYSSLFSDYTALSVSEALDVLQTTATTGLLEQEAHKRRSIYGTNQIEAQSRRWWSIVIDQINSTFMYILLSAALISFFFENHIEGAVIILIVLLNTLFGFYQEYKAEKTAQLLKSYLTDTIKVLRDGNEIELPTAELVPGDIIVLYAGDRIPADARIIWSQSLTVDESSLTGESLATKKNEEPLAQPTTELFTASNIGFSGTIIASGKALAVVFATGAKSSLGRIATLATQTARVTIFSKIITRFSTFILYSMVVSLIVIITVHVLVKGWTVNIIELLLFASALAISVVPETLPLVMTFALSQGARRLAKQKTVVKRLSAIEDLGNIEILCTDKTGTLTENILSVVAVYAQDKQEALFYALLAGTVPGKHLSLSKGFDNALFNALSLEQQEDIHAYHKVTEIPFDPSRLRSVALVRKDTTHTLVVRGAYESIITQCSNVSAQERAALQEIILQEGKQGNRTIAIAIKPIQYIANHKYDLALEHMEENLTYVGLISFKDPLKKDCCAGCY